MSSPYYFYDTGLAQQARDQIVAEFPTTYLAQEAQRLDLYYARTGRADGLKRVLERKGKDDAPRAHTFRLQLDPVGRAVYHAARATATADDAACVAALSSAAENAKSWAEEYAALNILEGFHGSESAPQVRAAASDAIVRNRDARCVFRARVLRMSIARGDGDVAGLIEDATTVLRTDPIPVVPERNNYEELRNCIQQAAEFLVENAQTAAGLDLLKRLAARFPDTTLSHKLGVRVAEIEQTAGLSGR